LGLGTVTTIAPASFVASIATLARSSLGGPDSATGSTMACAGGAWVACGARQLIATTTQTDQRSLVDILG
jgi:hypothetical protein